jgi:hypothetical protein
MCLFILIHKYPALQDRMQISRQIENTASVCIDCIQYWFSRSHGLINYIDTKAKCRHLKKLACKGVYLSEASSAPRFLFWGGVAIL